jgi:hypothetical protein
MFTLFAAIIFLMVWCLPGLYLARGLYSSAIRELNNKPVTVVPPKPERPKMRLEDTLHRAGTGIGNKCGYIESNARKACNCNRREEWLNLKNAWIDYNEWVSNYGHIKNGVAEMPKPNMKPIYAAVPLWPIALGVLFIQGGAKKIPNYYEIEQLQNDIFKELD